MNSSSIVVSTMEKMNIKWRYIVQKQMDMKFCLVSIIIIVVFIIVVFLFCDDLMMSERKTKRFIKHPKLWERKECLGWVVGWLWEKSCLFHTISERNLAIEACYTFPLRFWLLLNRRNEVFISFEAYLWQRLQQWRRCVHSRWQLSFVTYWQSYEHIWLN